MGELDQGTTYQPFLLVQGLAGDLVLPCKMGIKLGVNRLIPNRTRRCAPCLLKLGRAGRQTVCKIKGVGKRRKEEEEREVKL